MEEKLIRFAEILAIKDKLIRLNVEDLQRVYDSTENFTLFVDSICNLLEDDKEFFVFINVLTDDVLDVLNNKRFNENLDPDLIEKINFIITTFNSIKIEDEDKRTDVVLDYYKREEKLRGSLFPDFSKMLHSIMYDIDVFISIFNDSLEEFENESFVLASLSYFGNVFPEMYQDEEIKEIVLRYLNDVKSKKGLFRGKLKVYANNIRSDFFNKEEVE